MLFITWVLFGIGAAIAASNKGRSSLGWLVLGVLLGPFALLYVLLVPAIKSGGTSSLLEDETKICPHCAEAIKLAAKKCRFCGEIFSEEEMERAWRIKEEDYNNPRYCPFCRTKDVVTNGFLPGGGFGSWCPNCKKVIKYLKKNS